MKNPTGIILTTLIGICAALSFVYYEFINITLFLVSFTTFLAVFTACFISLAKRVYGNCDEESQTKIEYFFSQVKELYKNKKSLYYSHAVTAFTLMVLAYFGYIFVPVLYSILWWIKGIQAKDIIDNY